VFLSLVVDGVGFVLFGYGKKQERWPYLVAGLALIVYPYFASSIGALAGLGVALCVGLWPAVRNGW
jgi:C4-dicarboxylate transporter